MFSQLSTTTLQRRNRISKLVAGVLTAASVGIGVFGAGPALAQGYPTTVANFCSFNSQLGRPTLGSVDGTDYAAWALGSRYYDYIAVDMNGDSSVDGVVYAPVVDGVQTIEDAGLCTGPNSGRWFNAAALERQLAAQQTRGEQAVNEYYAEVGPQMAFDEDMQVLDDWDY